MIPNRTTDDNTETMYYVTRDGELISATPFQSSYIIDTGLVPGYQYEYKAYAVQRGLTSRVSLPYYTCPYPEPVSSLRVAAANSTSVIIQFDVPTSG